MKDRCRTLLDEQFIVTLVVFFSRIRILKDSIDKIKVGQNLETLFQQLEVCKTQEWFWQNKSGAHQNKPLRYSSNAHRFEEPCGKLP